MNVWRKNASIIGLLAVYILVAVFYSVANPLFESPDEVWHYEYVRWLVEGNGLPEPADVGHAPWHQEGSQPPLYYLAAAALTAPISTENAGQVIRYNPHAAIGQAETLGNKNMTAHDRAGAWPWQGVALAAHLARFFSILLGALTVLFTYLTAQVLFPWRKAVPPLAAALVAFNPQFLFISAAVNNDNLVAAVCAAGVWLLATILVRRDPAENDGRRPAAPTTGQLIVLGLLVGLAALSKLSGLLLAAYAGLVLTYVAVQLRTFGGLVRWGLIIGGTALVVAGWWYVRNALLFGDFLLLSAMFAILPKRAEPPTVNELLARLQGVWRSFWAVWGWFNVVAEPWLYRLYNWLTLAGLTGLLAGIPLQRLYHRRDVDRGDDGGVGHDVDDEGSSRDEWTGILFLALWVVMVGLLLLYWAQMRYPQGRLLYPAISAFAVLLAYGLTGWLPGRFQRYLAGMVAAGLLLIALYVPWRWIAPTYAEPAALSAGQMPPNEMEANFSERIQLAGYQLHDVEVHPGETLHLDLFWQALQPLAKDYSIFVHLTDADQLLQAQHDSFPGAGNGPTLNWTPGLTVQDTHEIVIPPTAPSPARLKVDVGVYDHATGERLLVDGYDHWTVGYITLLPPTGDSGLPHAMDVNFDDKIALRGFDFDRRTLSPGETVAVTLWWEALTKLDTNYTVFVHVVLPPGATWAQRDDTPQDGASPTSTWAVGQLIEDRYEVRLPEDAPPGIYFVEVGIFERATNDRLKVNFSEKGTVLGQLRVEAAGDE